MTLVIKIAAVVMATMASSSLNEGIALFTAGQYKAAGEKFKQAHAGSYLALTQAALGDCAHALPALTAVKEAGEMHKLAGLAATRCYASSGKTQEALKTAEDLKQQYPADADVLYVAAKAEMRAFDNTTVLMFRGTPGSYRVHELSAEIFETQKRYTDAVSEYRSAIEIAPNAPDLHFHLGRALLLSRHGQDSLEAAKAAFEQELQISPEDSGSHFQLGQIAQAQGNSAEAKRQFEAALRFSPEYVNAMVALGGLYAHEPGDQKAVPLLKAAVALQPTNEAAHYALLTAYRNAGDRKSALAEKNILDGLQKPASGEFSEFLKKLGEAPPAP